MSPGRASLRARLARAEANAAKPSRMRGASPQSPRMGDAGSSYVLEAIVIVALLVANVAVITAWDGSASDVSAPRVDITLAARDSLILLDRAQGDDEVFGNVASRQFVSEAVYGDATNLRSKLDSLLPPGARYNMYIDNGVGARNLVEAPVPADERVTAEKGFGPGWSTTFLVPDLERQPQGAVSVNLAAYPVFQGRTFKPDPDSVLVNLGDASTATLSPDATEAGRYEGLVVPALTETTGEANVTSEHRDQMLFGRASWTIEADAAKMALLSATAASARAGLGASTFTLSEDVASPGQDVVVTYDFDPLIAALGAYYEPDSLEVEIGLHAPIPPPTNEAEDRLETASSGVLDSTSGAWAMTVPFDGFYGLHVMDATITFGLVNGAVVTEQVAHLAARLDVAHPGKDEPPVNPAYRLVIEVWFDDWNL